MSSLSTVRTQESKSLQQLRDNTGPEKYNPTQRINTCDDMTPDLTDLHCNNGAFEIASCMQTTVDKAGSKTAMKLALGTTMKHPSRTMDKDRIEFAIPAEVPRCEYLIPSEHVGIQGPHAGEADCEVKVTRGGSITPGATLKIYGAYKEFEPSFNYSNWNGYEEYPMLSPAVRTGDNTVPPCLFRRFKEVHQVYQGSSLQNLSNTCGTVQEGLHEPSTWQ
ncbi:hypothetical protein BDW02DRAFT_608619 [Decorospora gaudefroyi]|uniref:Uncharacterized protein n=1 Tax=Decorospora gaudefroyi TaxID=184978 RepID=A0A6A5KP89_9PLEO|nr:hypothetical protein BDW02DRAFT_608619 [Decorospora gaudefroyi]